MSEGLNLLALDLGAESGRALVATLKDDKISLEEVHRFLNGATRVMDDLYWDVLHQWNEVKTGIGFAKKFTGGNIASMGVDTWGVDFGLLDGDGRLIGTPHNYRDPRTNGVLDKTFSIISKEEIFRETGLQFMQINTLFQLMAMVFNKSPHLDIAKTFLMYPDLLNYWLTGEKVCEFTETTTSQCYNPVTKDWARRMMTKLGIPTGMFPRIIQPGTQIGTLLPSVGEELGLGPIPVIAPACHDTGSAVAAVPASNENFGYISSGTWSLVGMEIRKPIINDQMLKYQFTNEGGVDGTFRLLRNVVGMWLLQECRREWLRQGETLGHGDVSALGEKAKPFQAFVNPNDDLFLAPGGMPQRIMDYCRKTGQPVPQDKGAIIRCVLESLAMKYRFVFKRMEELTGKKPSPIHIVGGGCQNMMLNQFTANACSTPVVAGPIEATAIGNALMQAYALGKIGSISDIRRIVRNSFDVTTVEPDANAGAWDDAYGKFLEVTGLG